MEDHSPHKPYRRPHYGDGDRLRVIKEGQRFSREVVVEGHPTPITITPPSRQSWAS
jgi:hypothetical protein